MITRRFAAVLWLAALIAFSIVNLALAQIIDCSGTWTVQTRLVAASDATNQNYRPGDLRMEQWMIRQSGTALQLMSQAGTVAGTIGQGYSMVFASAWDTGLGITSDIRIEARLTSSASMAGTIKISYYSAQFGYQVGLDAWTFEAMRVGN